jgi:hypothetical protein
MSRTLIDTELESLARAVARGRSVTSWVRRHDAEVDIQVAHDLVSQPEFKTKVDAHRLHVADQMVGKLMTISTRSINQMFTASTRSPSDQVKLSAGRALLDKWLVISRRFDDSRQLAELKTQIAELEQKKQIL